MLKFLQEAPPSEEGWVGVPLKKAVWPWSGTATVLPCEGLLLIRTTWIFGSRLEQLGQLNCRNGSRPSSWELIHFRQSLACCTSWLEFQASGLRCHGSEARRTTLLGSQDSAPFLGEFMGRFLTLLGFSRLESVKLPGFCVSLSNCSAKTPYSSVY